ncbi:hypothetical protein TD95_004598 [Thielaviopsis punctulata]|uniref:Ubiquitin carboxyl-terminal hydrolase 19 n=1 Tax=Thielaviopsis punctulata TaxID=72032 RepID=A0A0F4ZE79_9PEZI|nr:hypothetical protein TD95_004598 [Thielaviopsis punctulata]
MDPRFIVHREEFNSLQSEVKHHAERLSRLERRQQDDAALKSVWNSPFPAMLSGTPQQDPVSTNDYFDDLDEQGDHLLGSLHLDPTDEEPIRRGTASRANSVRFADSAIHGTGWNSQSRNSGDFGLMRPGSSLMMERTLSHKSDGRHSSAGHSVHSIHSGVSGRASSLGLDMDDDDESSVDAPVPPPSLFIMGSVPSIVRCWLTPKFLHDTLLYADICTGSQKSTLDFGLAKELDLHHTLERDINGNYILTIPVYLAEAIVTQQHSRSATNSHQIPSIMVTFEVVGLDANDVSDSQGLKIFIGSDALRAHSADVLLSQNKVVLYSIERDKLAVPFVRPEDENVFKNISTRSITKQKSIMRLDATAAPFVSGGEHKASSLRSISKGPDSRESVFSERVISRRSTPDPGLMHVASSRSMSFTTPTSTRSEVSEMDKPFKDLTLSENGSFNNNSKDGASNGTSIATNSSATTTATTMTTTTSNTNQTVAANNSSAGTEPDKRRESNVGIWGSWRNGAINNERENGLSGYQPAGKGSRNMKVLKPSRTVSSARNGTSSHETASGGSTKPNKETMGHSSSASISVSGTPSSRWESKRSASVSEAKLPSGLSAKDMAVGSVGVGPQRSNPVGGASAFSWMSLNGKPKTAVGE